MDLIFESSAFAPLAPGWSASEMPPAMWPSVKVATRGGQDLRMAGWTARLLLSRADQEMIRMSWTATERGPGGTIRPLDV